MTLRWKLLLVLVIAFPYSKMTMWKYALASFGILFLFQKFYPESFRQKLGLNFTTKQFPKAILLCVVLACLIEAGIQQLLALGEIKKESAFILSFWFLQPFFQSLNEEMLLRALFLDWIPSRYKNVIMAAVFSILHFIFCYFLFDTQMAVLAGVSLFLATYAMNLVYFETGSILFTWAIHLGINFSFFGGKYLDSSGRVLNDAEKFNLIYGHPWVVSTALVFAVAGLIWKRTRLLSPYNESDTGAPF